MILFANARAWLSAIDPVLPAATLVLVVFVAIYAVRRWLPGVWKAVEATVPFAGSLDPGPVLNALWKSWQVLPGALLGAAVSALSSGMSVRTALYGVAAGAAASLGHELMAAYKGQVGGKSPSSSPPFAPIALLLLCCCFGLSQSGCALFGSGGSFWPKVEHCAPSPSILVSQVATVLAAGGDYESALEQLALSDGKEIVECAVQAFVNSIAGPEGESTGAKSRGRAFLAKVAAQ